MQCVAVCCSVLQCVAVCCSALQCVAVCCIVLQCAVCCGALHARPMTHILVWCASAFSVTVCVQVCVCVQICGVVWPVSDGEFGCVGVCVTAVEEPQRVYWCVCGLEWRGSMEQWCVGVW